MESLERSSAVIDLGKRLVAELKLGDDVAAQWMAHLLAERIQDAENAPLENRVAAQNSCADLVLQLWGRRHSLPSRLRPMKKLEPLLRTLDSLDVNSGQRLRFMQEPPENAKIEEGIKEWLDAAVTVDDAARILVQYYLATAAEQASDEARPWIQSAVDAGADVTLEARVVRFVDSGLDRLSGAAQVARKILKKKIQTLETFASLAASHAAELRAKHDLLTDEADGAEPDDE